MSDSESAYSSDGFETEVPAAAPAAESSAPPAEAEPAQTVQEPAPDVQSSEQVPAQQISKASPSSSILDTSSAEAGRQRLGPLEAPANSKRVLNACERALDVVQNAAAALKKDIASLSEKIERTLSSDPELSALQAKSDALRADAKVIADLMFAARSLCGTLSDYLADTNTGPETPWSHDEYTGALSFMKRLRSELGGTSETWSTLKGVAQKPLVALVFVFNKMLLKHEELYAAQQVDAEAKAQQEGAWARSARAISAMNRVRALQATMNEIKNLEFKGLNADPSLLGPIRYDKLLLTFFVRANEALNTVANTMPQSADEMTSDAEVDAFERRVSHAASIVEDCQQRTQAEYQRRVDVYNEQRRLQLAMSEKDAVQEDMAYQRSKAEKEAEWRRAKQQQQRQEQEELRLKEEYERKVNETAFRDAVPATVHARTAELDAERAREIKAARKKEAEEDLEAVLAAGLVFASEEDRQQAIMNIRLEKAEKQQSTKTEQSSTREGSEPGSNTSPPAVKQKAAKRSNRRQTRRMSIEEKEKILKEKEFEQARRREERVRKAKLEAKAARRADVAARRAEVDATASDPTSDRHIRAKAECDKLIATDTEESVLFDAARSDNVAIVQAFLDTRGVEAILQRRDRRPSGGGRTLLHAAAWHGSIRVLRKLLGFGPDLDVIDTAYSKTTPLMEAVRAGRRDTTDALLGAGATVHLQDAGGDTALHMAVRRGESSFVRRLYRAAEQVRPGALKELLNTKNTRGKLPLGVAQGETMRSLLRELDVYTHAQNKRIGNTVSKLRRGLLKVVMSANVEAAAKVSHARSRRYRPSK